MFLSVCIGLNRVSSILWKFVMIKRWSVFSEAVFNLVFKWASAEKTIVSKIYLNQPLSSNFKAGIIAQRYLSSCLTHHLASFPLLFSFFVSPLQCFLPPRPLCSSVNRNLIVFDPASPTLREVHQIAPKKTRQMYVWREHLSKAIPVSNEVPNTMKLTEMFSQGIEKTKNKSFYVGHMYVRSFLSQQLDINFLSKGWVYWTLAPDICSKSSFGCCVSIFWLGAQTLSPAISRPEGEKLLEYEEMRYSTLLWTAFWFERWMIAQGTTFQHFIQTLVLSSYVLTENIPLLHSTWIQLAFKGCFPSITSFSYFFIVFGLTFYWFNIALTKVIAEIGKHDDITASGQRIHLQTSET